MNEHPYNVRITVAGVDFTGPGFETEQHAKVLKNNLSGQEKIQSVEVLSNE